MGRFRSPASQAKHAVGQNLAIGKPSHGQENKDGKIHGLGSARTHKDSLKGVAEYIAEMRLDPTGKGLAGISSDVALQYLEVRSEQVGQKQLDKDRQAIQIVLGTKLPVIKSELDQVIESRAYTHQQIDLIAQAQTRKHRLATRIAESAGLRAHELLTLMRIEEREVSSHRTWGSERFAGMENVQRYSVKGKGGLTREVAIASELAALLEECRLNQPKTVRDREIFYEQHYDLGGGKRWSDSFSKASKRELGWSCGGHGVRHTFAQARMLTLQNLGFQYAHALAIVSQEMGHFRPEIVEVYLR